jgi:hypothetical protein
MPAPSHRAQLVAGPVTDVNRKWARRDGSKCPLLATSDPLFSGKAQRWRRCPNFKAILRSSLETPRDM